MSEKKEVGSTIEVRMGGRFVQLGSWRLRTERLEYLRDSEARVIGPFWWRSKYRRMWGFGLRVGRVEYTIVLDGRAP